jgi:hypothetical protein
MLELLVLFGLVCAIGGAELGRGRSMGETLIRCVLVVVVILMGLSFLRVFVRFAPFMIIFAIFGFFYLKSRYQGRGALRTI